MLALPVGRCLVDGLPTASRLEAAGNTHHRLGKAEKESQREPAYSPVVVESENSGRWPCRWISLSPSYLETLFTSADGPAGPSTA